MKTVFIEVEHSFNWGKFMVGKFDADEWARPSEVSPLPMPLLAMTGWGREGYIWVCDLQTGEGACFAHGPHKSPSADLRKHAIWVCPMFEPFLTWLYKQDVSDLEKLPRVVKLTEADAPSAMAGYRRPGLSEAERRQAFAKTTELD